MLADRPGITTKRISLLAVGAGLDDVVQHEEGGDENPGVVDRRQKLCIGARLHGSTLAGLHARQPDALLCPSQARARLDQRRQQQGLC